MTGTWPTGFADGDIIPATEYKKQVGSIFDTTLGVSAASIDVTGIIASYAHLWIVLYARSDAAFGSINVTMRLNGDTAANYDSQYALGQASTASAAESFGATSALVGFIPANTAGANLFGAQEIFLPHYAGSANNKQFVSISAAKYGTTTTNLTAAILGSSWRSSAAINRITLLPSSGNFVAGTRATIYAMGA